ncbi:MAG: aldo/keto reductase [Phycisphaeraceae bacterium]
MEMEYRYLGRTGVRVSPLCVGCMNFGKRTDEAEAGRIVGRALEAGINFFDTANVYAGGASEQVLGRALKASGKRDFVVLATKAHGNMHKDEPLNPNRWGNSRRQIIEQCEASLRRLGTEWIDLYQIHRPHVDCPIDETLRALDDLVRQGKVRYIGCSTFGAWQVVESLWVSDRYSLSRFVTEQPPYNLLDRRIERELVPMAQTYDLAILPWSPLAGGWLTGKYRRDAGWPEGARYGEGGHKRTQKLAESDRAWAIAEAVAAMAEEKGCTPSQLALAWCMGQPGVTSPIAGPRTLAQLEDNLGALEVEVTDADRARLDELSEPGRGVVPFYESHFGPGRRW